LCLDYEAKGGGYLKAKDRRNNAILPAVSYTKTVSNRQICYRFDNGRPEHCSVTGTCSLEPLQLDHRISRDTIHTVAFTGWSDPVPTSGASVTASQIESYEIRVNKVLPSKGFNNIDYTTNILAMKVNHTLTEMTFNFTSDDPHLYCITLEVKDVADNVRQCRRFILVDTTTFIETRKDKPFQFTSASPDTSFTWQTHHNAICLSWKEYFFNKFYFDNELFNGIEHDPHVLITGTYEQISGELPVNGTLNVHGVVKYMVSWKSNDDLFTPELEVPNFLNQNFCKLLSVKDGETYTFNVRPVDIVGNTYNDSRTVFIDSSPPFVEELCIQNKPETTRCGILAKDTDPLVFNCTSMDYHSGILKMQWLFGMHGATTDKKEVVISNGEFELVICYLGVCLYTKVNYYRII